MERIGNKVSYIKKPLAKNSFVAAGLVAAALLFLAAVLLLLTATFYPYPYAALARPLTVLR